MKLIKLIDYIGNKENSFNDIHDYVELLRQPPKLGDFIPCDKEGKPLEKPKRFDDYIEYPMSFDGNKEEFECIEYKEALERVKFEGCTFGNFGKKGYLIFARNTEIAIVFDDGSIKWKRNIKTLEDLTTLGLTLKHKI